MKNSKSISVLRRAFLTVDLDCLSCEGRGFVNKDLVIGWGPNMHQLTIEASCKCLSHQTLLDHNEEDHD